MLPAQVLRCAAAFMLLTGLAAVGAVVPAAHAVDPGPVTLAIIAPVVTPPESTGLITEEQLEQYTSPTGFLSKQLDALAGHAVTLAIDPMILASIRLLGSQAPPSATAWLNRLANVSNESFLLSYADSDVTLATQAQSGAILGPESFDFAIEPDRFTKTEVTPSPTASTEITPSSTPSKLPPNSDTLPTAQDLLAWDSDFPDILWPRAGTVAASDLPVFSASGYETLVLSSSNISRDSASGPVLDVSGIRSIATDDSVSAALHSAATAVTPEALQTKLPALYTAVAQAGSVQNGAPRVVASLDRSPAPGGSLASAVTSLESNPAIRLVPLSAINGAQEPASLIDGPQDATSLAIVSQLLQAERAEHDFATIASDPKAVTAPRRLEILGLLATSWHSKSEWPSATSAFLITSQRLHDSVQIVTTSDYLFLANNATLPISVRNDLDQPVTVYVMARPQNARLALSGKPLELVIESHSQTKAEIPATAISNGTVVVVISLSSSAGLLIGPASKSEINVQAGWETPIVIIIASLVVIVFGIGIVRSVLRRTQRATTESVDALEEVDD